MNSFYLNVLLDYHAKRMKYTTSVEHLCMILNVNREDIESDLLNWLELNQYKGRPYEDLLNDLIKRAAQGLSMPWQQVIKE